MTDYEKYPKPSADKTAGRSATETGKATRGGQSHISGTMGKHQKTGTGSDAGSKGGMKGSY
jgi:hypothetical protein